MAITLRESICESRKLPRDHELIMARASLLHPEERDLIKAVFVHRQAASTIANLMGVDARSLRRRVHRIARRMASQQFLDAARSLHYLPADEAKLVKLAFCQGRPQREICSHLGLTRHELRRRLDRLSVQIRMIRKMTRPGKSIRHRTCAG